jgi:hypothetical protein
MHPNPPVTTLPRELRPYLDLLNQVFEIDKKAGALTESNSIARNIRNMRSWFERDITAMQGAQTIVYSLTFHNPIGEPYNETRADCDASIAGSGTEQLVITEVMKPIVWLSVGGSPRHIVQQAVVVVESKQPTIVQQQPEEQPTIHGAGMQSVAVGESYSFDGKESVKVSSGPAEAENPNGIDTDASPTTDAADSNTTPNHTPA